MKAKDLLTKAKAGLILDQPFYASILLKLKMEEDRTTPRIWIDGKSIGYNAAFIESQPLEIVKGILAHEVSHIIFLHHLRRKDRDFETWNDSADHAINPIIENAGFKLPPERLSDRRFFGKPTEDIFNTLWGERPAPTESPAPQPQEDPEGSQEDKAPGEGSGNGEKTESPQKGNEPGDQPGEAQESQGKEETPNNDQPQGQDGKGQGKGQGEAQEGKDQGNGNGSGPTGGNAQGTGNANGDRPADQQQQPAPPEYSDPGKTGEVRDYPDPDPTAQRQAEEEIKVEIIQSAQYAKKHGKLPAELERYIQELLNPVLPWKEILARFVDQVSRNDYSWTRPNARYMAQGFYLPALQTPERRCGIRRPTPTWW